MKLRAYGDAGWLLDCESLAETQRWYAGLRADTPGFVIDIAHGASSLVVAVDRAYLRQTRTWIESCQPGDLAASGAETVTIAVSYDGPDLDDVASHTRLSVDEVIALHSASTWTVAFGGFAPGFGYLTTDHDRLHVPRRKSPRPQIATGSVGLAGEFSGIYPRTSPGGWQIIGHTAAILWNTARNPPALLRPGMTVRFEATS